MRLGFTIIMAFILVLAFAATNGLAASCSAGGCGNAGNWEASAQSFLNSDVPLVGLARDPAAEGSSFRAGEPNTSTNLTPAKVETEAEAEGGSWVKTEPLPAEEPATVTTGMPEYRSDLFPGGRMLKAMPSVSSSDVVIDTSNEDSPGSPHVRGAVHIPAGRFLYENGTIRPPLEMAEILGGSGVSQDDGIVLYSRSLESGEATFVLWVLHYLGHDDASVLDGGLTEWSRSSLPLEVNWSTRPPLAYTPEPRPGLLATYDYVASENVTGENVTGEDVTGGKPQIVDARPIQEYGRERIPGSSFADSGEVMAGGRIKLGSDLNSTFAGLDRSRPVVVYSDDVYGASVVWYALQLMGFDSRLYTWQDWTSHAPPGEAVGIQSGRSDDPGSRYKKLGR